MGKAERTKQLIIEKAAVIFNEKGIAGATIDDVLAATKMAKGGFYGHFDSKEALSYAAVDHNLGLLVDKLSAALSKHTTAKAKLFAYLDFFRNPLQPPLQGGCPMVNFGTEADDTNAIVRQKVKKTMEKGQQGIRAIIEQGIAAGEFKKNWNGKEFAVKMFALIEGGGMVCKVLGSNSQMHMLVEGLKREIEEQAI
jgi:TetR/AcrR family transcriptional regulator, transcriptional repressor for nem operon